MKTTPWTHDQLKLAFQLYCQLPFGRLHRRNPEIIALAKLIDRTPSAVAMKLVNFASLDPTIVASGRKGLSSASTRDREIWDAFHADWEGLVVECARIRATLTDPHEAGRLDGANQLAESAEPTDFSGDSRTVTVEQRIKQSFFRRTVLTSYQQRCCVCDLSVPTLLIASHIVPWHQNKENRLNPRNGLCLSALYDRAFDRGLITFDDDWRLLVANELRQADDAATQALFVALEGKRMQLPERFAPDPTLMQWHREQIFLGQG